jgi:perosamine synthetase
VHLYGHPADMRALGDLCRPRGVALIEDAAEGLGASIDGVQAGALGDVGTFSFYGNKTITTGEGGMVTTNHRTLATRVRFLKDHGMSPRRRYYHSELAFNYRMTNIQAALGVAQLTQLGRFLSRKENIYRGYASGIRAVDVALNPVTPGVHSSFWMSCLLLGRSWSSARDDIAMMLALRGVDTRPFFEPMSSLPHLARYRCVGPDGGECSVSKSLSARGLNLPSSCALTDADVAMIASIVSEVLNELWERRTCQSQLHLSKFVGDASVSV